MSLASRQLIASKGATTVDQQMLKTSAKPLPSDGRAVEATEADSRRAAKLRSKSIQDRLSRRLTLVVGSRDSRSKWCGKRISR